MARTPKKIIKGASLEAETKRPRLSHYWLEATRVDRDAEFACMIDGEKYREKRAIKLKASKKGEKLPEVRGMFCRVVKQAKGQVKVEKHFVKNIEGLRAFLADPKTQRSRMLEADPFLLGGQGGGSDTGGLPPNNEYLPLMGGPFNKQLYFYDYLSMHAKCFEAKNHNPLAKEIVDVITFFSMGKGLKIAFRNAQLQEAFKIFEERNKLYEFLRMDSDSITWAGEIMTQKVKGGDGYPLIKHVDPSSCWEIITDPRDIETVYYYHLQFPTQYQLVYKPGDISQEYVVVDIPADEIIHKKINTVPGEKRGRSDLFNILGWLKRFKDYYDARVTKAQLEESWTLKKKVKGNGADVQALMNDPEISRVPSPGSVLIENEAIDTSYMTPTASSAGNAMDSIGESIRSICATGAGLSPEYLGVAGKSSSRATSITRAEPAVRKFEDRQMFFENYVREIVAYWQEKAPNIPTTQVRQASLGALKKAIRERRFKDAAKEATALVGLAQVTEPIDDAFEVIFPEIGVEDRSLKIQDIGKAQALRYISRRRAATMVAKELGITSFDNDEEQEEIREETADREADPLYNGAPDPAMQLLGKAGMTAAAGAGKDGEGSGGSDDVGSGAGDKAEKGRKQ